MTDSTAPVVSVITERATEVPAPATWAMDHLVATLAAAGVNASTGEAAPDGLSIVVNHIAGDTPESRESFTISRPNGAGGPIVVSGGDRGLVYGLSELADRAQYAGDPLEALRSVEATSERPASVVRSILRTFSCEVEDKPWFYDRSFWENYLTELTANRVNRFQLALGMQYNYGHHPATDNYLCFPYPFLLDVPGYSVKAEGIDSAEQRRNLETLRFISDEAARRGIHFQLGLWNHAYDQGEGSRPQYPITGLTPETHAEYCAAALRQLLLECPSIQGLTMRVHYEGGIPEPEHGEFWRTVMSAVAAVGRAIEIDMHAKGVDQELLDIATGTGMPVVVSAKYWAEHQGLPYHQTTIREKERATDAPGAGLMAITAYLRRFTRYGYGDFLRENRNFDVLFRIWPGTQRVLLWGDPEFAAGYGRLGTIGGALGVELCEPLTFKGRKGTGEEGGRDPYADPALKLDGQDWRKYRYTYRLWGRLLYNPDADPESWRRFLRAEYGAAAEPVENALAPASRILPLVTVVHGLGASNNGYWPEIYLNMPLAGGPNAEHYKRDTAQPPTHNNVSAFDPSMFYRIDEYADDLLAGRRDGRYSPETVASWLDDLAERAEENLRASRELVADPKDPTYRRTAVDIEAQAGLGRFFAGKFRAGLAYALYERTKDVTYLGKSLEEYRKARDAFAHVARITANVYRDDLTFGDLVSEHGSWVRRLPDIEADLADLERRYNEAKSAANGTKRARIPEVAPAPSMTVEHTPPEEFKPGSEVILEVSLPEQSGVEAIDLHYRHLNQGEDFQRVAMSGDGTRYTAAIPASYTTDEYPLMYYFTLRFASGDARIVPGFADGLAAQPYHVVRMAKSG